MHKNPVFRFLVSMLFLKKVNVTSDYNQLTIHVYVQSTCPSNLF